MFPTIDKDQASSMALINLIGWADLVHESNEGRMVINDDDSIQLSIGAKLANEFGFSANSTTSYLHVPSSMEGFLLFAPYKHAEVKEHGVLSLKIGLADVDNASMEILLPIDADYVHYFKQTPFLGLSGDFEGAYAAYEVMVMMKRNPEES